MKKLFLILLTIGCSLAALAGNTITYTATVKLQEKSKLYDHGFLSSAFDVTVVSHVFANGTGTITFSGDVSYVGTAAFYYCDELTGITLPNSVTEIRYMAFAGCSSLQSIVIPNSVTTIGEGAFRECTGLRTVQMSNAVTTIGSTAFNSCSSLTTITLPSTLTSIGSYAFRYCESLQNVTLPEGLTSVGNGAFLDCVSMTDLHIPASLTSIGSEAFHYCVLSNISVAAGNTVYDSRNTCNALIETATNTLLWGTSTTVIPSTVTAIGQSAFHGDTTLTTLNIPGSVTSIGASAFSGCKNLTRINIPASVSRLEDRVFYYCSNLVHITVEAATPPSFSNAYYCFYDVNKSGSYRPMATLYVPEASIDAYRAATGWRDFANISPIRLTDVITYKSSSKLPEATTSTQGCMCVTAFPGVSIVSHTFADSVGTITFSGDVTEIGDFAFYSCLQLTSLSIPASVTKLGAAFAGCANWKSIRVPAGVTEIVATAFWGCSPDQFIVEPGNTVYDSRNNCNALIETATNKLVTGFQSTVIPATVTTIGEAAFFVCPNLESLDVPEGVTTIGASAFFGCQNLKHITLPSSLRNLGASAFYSCMNLESVSLPDSIMAIPDYAFFDCEALSYLKLPKNLTSIGEGAIQSCYSLSAISIPSGVTNIGTYAFASCRGLTSITSMATTPPACESNCFSSVDKTIPLYVPAGSTNAYRTAAEWSQFNNRSAITNNVITYTASGRQSINTDAMDVKMVSHTYSNGTGTITFEGPVTQIGDKAFQYCYYLHSVTLPGSVKYIGERAFQSCWNLTEVDLPSELISIGAYAFSGCSKLTGINIPAFVAQIGESAFYGIDSLASISVAAANTVYDSRNNCNALIETATNTLIKGCRNSTVPSTVAAIGTSAFSGCVGLTSITLPNSVKTIGENGFYACKDLTTVVLSDSLESIGRYAFQHSAITSLSLPASLKQVREFCFSQCENLTSLYVAAVPEYLASRFDGCNALSSIVVDPSNTDYDSRNNCNAIIHKATNTLVMGCKNTIIPSSVIIIGDDAFGYRTAPDSIVIPSSVTRIGSSSFRKCTGLNSIISWATTPPTCVIGCFEQVDMSIPVYVPGASLAAYQAANVWKDFTNFLPIWTVSVASADAAQGSVQGGGICYGNTGVSISATPAPHYHFVAWSDGSTEATRTYVPASDIVLTATFAIDKFVINFMNQGGVILQSDSVEYGQLPAYRGATPTKAATAEFSYTFSGWSPAIQQVNGGATYVATYSSTRNRYSVLFVDEDGNVLQSDSVEYGQLPAYRGETPTKAATAEFSYTFSGWSPSIQQVSENTIYVATYTSMRNRYSVLFVDEDGNVLQSEYFDYGQLPVYRGETPTKAATAEFSYTFSGWSPSIQQVTENTIYVATFTSTRNRYSVLFVDEDGNVLQSDSVEYGQLPAYRGETPTKAATAEFSYTFSGWDREFVVVTENCVYIAQFDAVSVVYTVEITVENGTFSIDAAAPYHYGDMLWVTVVPASGYEFDHWSDGNTDNPRQVVVLSDVTLSAECVLVRTALSDADAETGVRKIIRDGQLYIITPQGTFDALGRKVAL